MGRAGELRARGLKSIRQWLGISMPERSVYVKTIGIALFILCIDAGTKALAAGSYGLGERHEWLFLSIVHVQNPGISLVLFSQLGLIGSAIQVPLYVFAALAVVGTAGIFFRTADAPYLWFPAALALGGALGDVLDRLYHGYVTDFIYIPSLGASANIADFAIFLGLTLFFLLDWGTLVFALGRKYRDAIFGSSIY